MADYAVLYHDPVRVSDDTSCSILAAQSVWVCRNDRYAFEVHVLGQRCASDPGESLLGYGEGRYRFALAILGGRQARRAAADLPPKNDPVTVTVGADEVREVLANVPPIVAVTFGDVVYRFRTTDVATAQLSRAAG